MIAARLVGILVLLLSLAFEGVVPAIVVVVVGTVLVADALLLVLRMEKKEQ